MFPTILGMPIQPILVACGVLAAITTAERLAAYRHIAKPNRIGTAVILGLVGIFLGERLVLFARGWRDFLAHPLWMLGLISVRDPRYFFAGAAVALVAGAVYLFAARIPFGRAIAAILPATLLLLAFIHAGYLAVGAEPGRPTRAHWGIVNTSRLAHALYGTPLLTRFVPVAAILSVSYAMLALAGTIAARQGRNPAGALLLLAGLLTVLAGQLAMQWPGEPMLLGAFTWPQTAGVVSALSGAALLLRDATP